jgi:hypothetical protein
VLDGVHHRSRVFAGGRHLRDHVGGFTRFECDLAAGHAYETVKRLFGELAPAVTASSGAR